jgi:hypothetical protein
MAALTAQTVTAAGITPAAPAQISAWAGPDTISATEIGERGLWAEVANASGGSLDFRVQDPGRTPAGNTATNGYTTVTVPNNQERRVFIGKNNVDTDGLCDVGASTTNAAFTIRLFRY